jgi:hypothetical protein
VSLRLVPGEAVDQPIGLPGQPGDHPNTEGLGIGSQAVLEGAAEEHMHSSSREMLEPPGAHLVSDGESTDAMSPDPVGFGDDELVRRTESGSYVVSVKCYCQHRSVLLEAQLAGLMPDKKVH